jgi:hypothetical protein
MFLLLTTYIKNYMNGNILDHNKKGKKLLIIEIDTATNQG